MPPFWVGLFKESSTHKPLQANYMSLNCFQQYSFLAHSRTMSKFHIFAHLVPFRLRTEQPCNKANMEISFRLVYYTLVCR